MNKNIYWVIKDSSGNELAVVYSRNKLKETFRNTPGATTAFQVVDGDYIPVRI